MDGLWQALHHSVRLPFFSVSFWVNTIDLSETASTWRVFLPSPPPIHPSRKRDRVTWFSAKLAFDSLSKLFHCCRIHEHPCGLSPPSYFFFLFLVYSVEIDLPLPIKRARRLEKGGGEELNREGNRGNDRSWGNLSKIERCETFMGILFPFPSLFGTRRYSTDPCPQFTHSVHPFNNSKRGKGGSAYVA